MKVLVIGGAGKMGEWFTRYFLERGSEVVVCDTNTRAASRVARTHSVKAVSLTRKNVSAADLILVSVPIAETRQLLDKLSSIVRKKSVLIEIASVKSGLVARLRRIASRGVTTLSLHPLFGPGARLDDNGSIAVVPVRDGKNELKVTKTLFPNGRVFLVDEQQHDEATAITLWGTYLLNAALASVIANSDPTLLRQMAGPRFSLQFLLSLSALQDEPDLYQAIRKSNPYAKKFIYKFMKALVSAENSLLAVSKDGGKFLEGKRSKLSRHVAEADAYGKIYEIAPLLDQH